MEIETERTAAAAPAGDGSSMWTPALSLKCPSPQSYVHCAHKPLRIRTKMWRTFSTCSICSQRPAQECWLISSASWTRCAIVPRLVCIAVKGNFFYGNCLACYELNTYFRPTSTHQTENIQLFFSCNFLLCKYVTIAVEQKRKHINLRVVVTFIVCDRINTVESSNST